MGMALAQTPENYQQLEAKTQLLLNQTQDQRVQLDLDLKALEVEIGHLPPLLTQMQQQLQSLKDNYQKVKAKAASPLNCTQRNDLAYAINGDLSYQLTGDMHYSLTQDLGTAQSAVNASQRRLELSLKATADLLNQLQTAANQLRQVAAQGPERSTRLLAEVAQGSQKSRRQILDTQRRSRNLMRQSHDAQQAAGKLYQEGKAVLAQAKVWLEGLKCQA